MVHVETPNLGVSTKNDSVVNGIGRPKPTGGKNDKWESGTLGVIINQYKRACTINARKIHADFTWLTRFHDHIIRNEETFQHIRSYIAGNPASWEVDTLYG
jgi:putative transposase